MRGRIKQFTRCAVVGALMLAGQVAHALTAGDVTIIGFDCDGSAAPDQINLLFLADVPAGNVFFCCDNEIAADGGTAFTDTNEATYMFTNKQAIAKGTVIYGLEWNSGAGTSTEQYGWSKANGGTPGLGGSGDTLYLFQTAEGAWNGATRTFLFGYNNQSGDSSQRAGGLTAGTTWLDFTDTDVCSYKVTGATYTGAKEQLLTALGTAANWNFQANSFTLPTSDYTFSVTGGGLPSPTVTITDPATDPLTVPNATVTRDIAGTSANAVGSMVWSNSLTHASGSVAASASWGVSGIALDVGDNAISVTATNEAGAAASDSVTVTRQASAALSAASDMIRDSGFAEPSNLAYASCQESDLTASSLQIGSFILRDGGATVDADSANTTLDAITFMVANGQNLRRVALYDGTTEVAETAGGTTVAFTGLTGLTATDGSTKTFKMLASFNATVTDNQQVHVTVASAAADASGSTFAAADAGGAATDVSGDVNRIEVQSSKLVFSATPTSVGVNQSFSATVQAHDANDNVDLDSTASVTVSKATGDGALSSASGLTAALAAGSREWADLLIDAAGTFNLQASADELTAATSGDITALFAQLDEPFSYADGALITVSGGAWATHSGSTPGQVDVVDGRLNLTDSETEDVSRSIGTAYSSGVLYYAFDLNMTAQPGSGAYFAHLLSGTSSFRDRLWAKSSGSGYVLACTSSSTAPSTWWSSELALSTTFRVVVKADLDADTSTLWVAPSSEESPSVSLTSATAVAPEKLAFRQSAAIGTMVLDNLKVGLTFAEVEGAIAAPTLTITTADAVVDNGTARYTVSGTAANAVGTLTLTSNLGATVEQSASAAWTFENVALAVGVNTFTLTASNSVGLTASDKVTLIRQAVPASGTVLRIASFSDPHYFATNLLVSNGSAFQTYLAQDRKLITESVAITKATVDQIIAQNPDYVLVTGDLTKDGEYDSHVAFASELARLEAAGAKVLVIPGNHDINNSGAVSYDGASTTPVANVSPEQFKTIYAQFGYDLASATDPASVAYAVELSPSRTMLCMDSCQYGATAGAFDAARLTWITNRIAVAHAAGKLVVGMMHHGLMEHFQGQKSLFSEYVLDDYTTVAPLFASLGLKAVFTGHFHANDIVKGSFNGKDIFDIETGSTVTWPCPFRVMELDAQGNLSVATHTIEAIDYDLGSVPDFETYAYDYLENGMLGISAYMLQSQFGLDAGTAAYLAPSVTEALIAHYAGDEAFTAATPTTQAIVGGMLGSPDPLQRQLGGGIYSILTDLTPSDNSASLDLSTPPVAITVPTDGTVLPASEDRVALVVDTFGLAGVLTFSNGATGYSATAVVGAGSPTLPLVYGLNALTVSGTNTDGQAFSATVTVTRQAPVPAGGTNVLPEWDSMTATGAVHVAWTTNDWYQFQTFVTCLPGGFEYRDPFGGALEPGDGAPAAQTLGATYYRYEAADAARYAVVEGDADFSVRVPCYGAGAIGVPLNQEVLVCVTYWDAPGNPEWVQGWSLSVTPEGGTATAPVLSGRTHGADGLITEAYAFTVTNVTGGVSVSFSADPALSAGNPAYVSGVTVDTLAHAPLLVAAPQDGSAVDASTSSLALSLLTAGLVGELTFRNETTGYSATSAVGAVSPALPLVYGLNNLTVSGTNAAGQAYSATVTVTRQAPVPAKGTNVLLAWDYTVATGAVHVAWTTNDWYQFQTFATCLPGEFVYRDPFGGVQEPGDGAPAAQTLGATTYRYDADDGARYAVVEGDADFSVRVPCYDASAVGVPLTQDVLVRVTYWDAPGNPEWVQGWSLSVTPEGGTATAPVLSGRTHGADGLITEAYAFAVTNVTGGVTVSFAADPALSGVNPAYVSAIAVDTLAHPTETAYVIRTTVEGEGTVTPVCVMVAAGSATNIEVTAAGEWRRIRSLSTNGVAVAAAEDSRSFTLSLTNVSGDYANQVAFGYRSDAHNPGGVPTAWLASFGQSEATAFVTADRSVADKYLLDLNPYETATVLFAIDDFVLAGGSSRVTVRLLVNGAEHPHINGTLTVEGRSALTTDWSEVTVTPVTGTVFEGGRHRFDIPTDSNLFFRAVIH